jgi:deazaflavin-dependent oxidoreductase (nitroreductase family)
MTAPRLSRGLRLLFRAPACVYDCGCGRLLGHRFLLLIQTGRRTGLPRRTVLEVIEYREEVPEAIVMSAFGPDASWLRNIQTNPTEEVIIGSQRFAAVHRLLSEEEAVKAMMGYQRRHRFIAPIIRFALSRFVGWRYDGSERACRRLVAQLPLIGFRPRS